MKPYYEEASVVIYNADSREIIDTLDADSLITDPVWPNCEHLFPTEERYCEIAAKRLTQGVLSFT